MLFGQFDFFVDHMRLLMLLSFVFLMCSCDSGNNMEPVIAPVEYIDSTRIDITELLDLGNKPSSLQGLAVYNNKAYQFYSSSVCGVFDLDTKQQVAMLNLPEGHYGSTEFSHEFKNSSEDIPLLYVGGKMSDKQNPGFVVINLNTQSISRIVEFDQPVASQVLCAFDFQHGIGYSFGYLNDDPDHETAPYEVTPFDIETGKCDIANRFYIKNEGHLQDAVFEGDKIYVITGWNKQWNDMDIPIKIFGIDVERKRTFLVMNLGFENNEGEGIALYKGGFLISARKLYKIFHVTYH